MTRKKGRPSAYDPKFADEVISFMADGYSIAGFAGHIGGSRSTVYKWADESEEFSDALKIAQAKAALWWERQARTIAATGEGNASVTIFGLKNRVADEWRDKREVEVEASQPFGAFVLMEATGDEDGPVSVN